MNECLLLLCEMTVFCCRDVAAEAEEMLHVGSSGSRALRGFSPAGHVDGAGRRQGALSPSGASSHLHLWLLRGLLLF